MVTRRNFITITVVSLVLLFLFMFSGVLKEALNEYGVNAYADKNEGGGDSVTGADEMAGKSGKSNKSMVAKRTGDVVYVGKDENIRNTAGEWSRLMKREFEAAENIADIEIEADNRPYLIILDGKDLMDSDVPTLHSWSETGTPIVVASLPTVDVIRKNPALATYLGIAEVRADETKIVGVSLRKGLLLGGAFDYRAIDEQQEEELQDLNLTVPWYKTAAGTKTYVSGLLSDEEFEALPGEDTEYKNQYLPAIVWRCGHKDGVVFIVNADYMESLTGLGFLSGFAYESSSYSLYPVVNAQSTMLVNFPTFTSENDERMQEIYSRDSYAVLRDIVWPGAVAIMENAHAKATCMIASKLDYENENEPDRERMIYFMKLLRENEGEAGLSLSQVSDTPLNTKLDEDYRFLYATVPKYRFQTAYIGAIPPITAYNALQASGFTDVDVLAGEYDETSGVVAEDDEMGMLLSVINQGESHTFSEDFRTRSLETTLAYSLVAEDLSKVLYPESSEDEWQNVLDKFASYNLTFFSAFDRFSEVTVSECGSRARTFLNTDYTVYRSNNEILLNVNEAGGYFILRTHGEQISSIVGADYVRLEEDAYLLTIKKPTVSLKLKTSDAASYFWERNGR